MRSKSDIGALESKLARIVSGYNNRSDTNMVRFMLWSPSRAWRWEWSSPESLKKYFIASTTKLYVTSLIMQLRAEGLLALDEPVVTYVGQSIMADIHRYKGIDYSDRITVLQLLSHTSGIADYFEQRRRDGTNTIGRALQQDFSWTFEDALHIAKEETSPKFPPSFSGKAFYSDTNYQLLGRIVEELTGRTYEEALQQRILDPLGLRDTFSFTPETIGRYDSIAPMLYGNQPLRIPRAMSSVRADGGIVSTAEDGITFLEALKKGGLFPLEYLGEMCREWRAIFPPLAYGIGIMRFSLPRIFTLFKKVPEMIGHSGASGAVLYYVPELDLYVSGTVNQIRNRSLSYNVMTRLVMAFQDGIQ